MVQKNGMTCSSQGFKGSFSNNWWCEVSYQAGKQLKTQPVKLQFWPLTGPVRIIWFLDASCRKKCRWVFTERRDSIFSWLARAFLEGWNFIWEYLLTAEVIRLREQYSQQPWQNCVHSWNVSFHASSSVDCGWTCQVKLQIFTWGLTRRTWWQQQEQFTYLSKNKQFTWFPCCDVKPVQEVFMTLLTFQLRIVWHIASRSHRRRQTIWSQHWKQWGYWKLTFIRTSGLSWRTRHSCPHGVQHSCTQGRELLLRKRLKDFSLTSSTRRTIPCNVCEDVQGFWESRCYKNNVCTRRLTHLFINEADDILYVHCQRNHFPQCPTFLCSQCCGNVDVKTRWSLQSQSLDENICWTRRVLRKLLLWVSVFSRHSVDLSEIYRGSDEARKIHRCRFQSRYHESKRKW